MLLVVAREAEAHRAGNRVRLINLEQCWSINLEQYVILTPQVLVPYPR